MRSVAFLLTMMLSLPTALAYRSGWAPLDMPVEMISRMFNIPILSNTFVQVGFIRFGIWLMVFTLAFYSFHKFAFKDDRKTSGILAATIAFIGAIFMPQPWVIAQGGIITALITSALIIGLLITIVFTVAKLSNNKFFVVRLLSIMLIFIMLAIIDILEMQTGARAVTPIVLPFIWRMPRGR